MHTYSFAYKFEFHVIQVRELILLFSTDGDFGFQRTDSLSDADPPDFTAATVQSSRC